METADFNHEDFSKPRAGDERLAVRFFVKAKQDSEASVKEGRPIFKDVDFIQIVVPGDRNNAHVRPVAPNDKIRFQKQWEHWKATQNNDAVIGTPLEAWGILSLSQVEEFRYFGVRTIEQMASLNDSVCQKMHGAVALKQRATNFLQIMKEEAPMRRVQAELDARDKKIAELDAAIKDQASIIEELRANKKGK